MNQKSYINISIATMLFALFLFNKHQQISHLNENSLCSSKFDNITVYHGPSTLNNKSRIILKKQYPLYILKRKKNWVKIIDYKNRIGWILKNNLSEIQRGMIKNKITLTEDNIIIMPNVSVKIVAILENHCLIEIKNKKLKINKKDIWIGEENSQ